MIHYILKTFGLSQGKNYAEGGGVGKNKYGHEFTVKRGDLVWLADEGNNGLMALVISEPNNKNEVEVYIRGYGGEKRLVEFSEIQYVGAELLEYAQDTGDLIHYPTIAKRMGVKFNPKYEQMLEDDEYAHGGGVEWTDMYDAEKYKDGGCLHVYKHGGNVDVHILNEGQKFDEDRYPAIFKDYDHDGTLNGEDIQPTNNRVKDLNDEPKLSKVFSHLLNIKNQLDHDMYSFVSKLKDISDSGNKIYARTKTPFSIINKIVDKRILDKKKGLTDLIGTTLEVNDKIELDKVKDIIESGRLGKVIEFENFYDHPKDGYRAYHFLIEYNGHTVELQLKTKRMKQVNMLSHSAYKAKELDANKMDYITNLVDRADLGDKKAQGEFDDFLNRPNLKSYFFKR